jgi:hypothetical protein
MDEDIAEMEEGGPFEVIIAPDATHKTNHSGGTHFCS